MLPTPDDGGDRYFDVAGFAAYTGVNPRTVRRWLDDPINPLPSHHVHGSGRDRGRVLISKREGDAWIASFPPHRSKTAPARRRDAAAAQWARKLNPPKSE
jgi:hypothetical protein